MTDFPIEKKKRVRWGIVAPGRIANQFARDIHFASSAKLVAVASRSEERANEFAQQHKIKRVFSDYQSMFEDDEVQAIYIASPHSHHFEQAKAALEAGKHVLCEKPLCINPTQSSELIQLAEKKGLFLMEALWTYFLPAVKKAKKWFKEGRIGELHQIIANFGYPMTFDEHDRLFNPKLAGGCLLDMGIYPLAINNYFHNSAPRKLKVRGHFAETGVEDQLEMFLDYEHSTATLGCSFRSKLPNNAYIIGSEGTIVLSNFWMADSAELYKSDECIDSFKDLRKGDGFEFEIEEASRCIQNNELQSEEMPWHISQFLQEQMEEVAVKLNKYKENNF